MSLYAIDNLDDALDATSSFLWPIDPRTWLKLAMVVLFVAGPGSNVNPVQFNVPADTTASLPGEFVVSPDFGPRVLVLVAAIIVALVLLALLLALIGAIMEFVFIESLRREEVTVRRYWRRRWRQGVRLFVFRVVLGLAAFIVVAGFIALGVFSFFGGGLAIPTMAILLMVPVAFLYFLVLGLVNGFTTVFVAPIMILEDCGVLDGWRRLWPLLRSQPKQFLAYAVVGFILSIVGGIVVGFGVLVAGLLLLVPFGLIGVIGAGLLTVGLTFVAIPFLAVLVVVYGLSLLAAFAVVQVPVQAYLRYHALFVLGDANQAFDLVSQHRDTGRSEDGASYAD